MVTAATTSRTAAGAAAAAATKITTRITKLWGCKYPIVLPGMSWISTPELVAAVSNAGGLGILATGPLSPSQTRESIQGVRSLLKDPNLPFGIGATLLMPGAKENAQVALEERVPVLNVSLGVSDWIAQEAHSYGATILATVTNTKHAEKALTSGRADALMVTGHEAAAHGGDVTSLVLIPSVARAFPDTPLVAAGGFATGSGLAAALTLGADGIAMGTRFAVTSQSPLSWEAKHAILHSSESQTLYGKNFDGIPARVLQTPVSERLNAAPPPLPLIVYRAFANARRMNIPLWKVLPGLLMEWNKMYAVAQFGAATDSLEAATIHGDLHDKGVQFVGQCQGLIHDEQSKLKTHEKQPQEHHSVPSVEVLVQRIVDEAVEASIRTHTILDPTETTVAPDLEHHDDDEVEAV